jgi:hypothetical protein
MVGQMAGELDTLARQGASGAPAITGDRGGTIYLQEGCLAFAESAAVADLGSRLVNSRRLGVDQWSQAQRDSQPDGCAGEALAGRPDRGRTTPAPDLAVSRWVPPDQRVMPRVLAGLRRLD